MREKVDRIATIKRVGENFHKGYNPERIQGILNVTNGLEEQEFKDLCFEIQNTCKSLPLRDEWIDIIRKMGLGRRTNDEDGKCAYCENTGYINAILKETKKRIDAVGNPWPKEKAFRCWCESGKRLTAGLSFTREIAEDWYPLKYYQQAQEILGNSF